MTKTFVPAQIIAFIIKKQLNCEIVHKQEHNWDYQTGFIRSAMEEFGKKCKFKYLLLKCMNSNLLLIKD